MCGRFVVTLEPQVLEQTFAVSDVPEVVPRYNIAPSQPILAVCETTPGTRSICPFRWGLIPHWAKDSRIGSRMINARSETVFEKPSFRQSIRQRRCLIPANGYYEWLHEGKTRTPFYLHHKENQPLAFAAIWDTWKEPGEGAMVESCAILTTAANRLVAGIHERMPVLIAAEDYSIWLNREVTEAEALSRCFASSTSDELVARKVSNLVNNPKHDAPECLTPVA